MCSKLLWTILLFCFNVFITLGRETSFESSPEILQVAQVLFRHGARNIVKTYATDPYSDESHWPGGFKELACIGQVQGYELGRYLRSRYPAGYINESYIPKEIYVLSSDYDRTIQTAYSVIAGLYPPNEVIKENHEDCKLIQWKDVPVHSIPLKFDNILRMKANCSKYKSLEDDFYENSDVMKEILFNNKELMSYFRENTGLEIKRTTDFTTYYDSLFVEDNFGLPLPNWTKKIFGTKEAISLLDLEFKLATYTDEMKRLRAGPLFNQIVANFNEGLNVSGTTQSNYSFPRKLYLMSGHDSSLVAFLNPLGLYGSGPRPPYAAAILIELYGENGQDYREFNVKLSYRNESTVDPVALEIPNCGNPCKYEKFLEITKPFRPEDWNTECQSVESSLSGAEIALLTMGVAAVALIFAYMFVRAYRQYKTSVYVPL